MSWLRKLVRARDVLLQLLPFRADWQHGDEDLPICKNVWKLILRKTLKLPLAIHTFLKHLITHIVSLPPSTSGSTRLLGLSSSCFPCSATTSQRGRSANGQYCSSTTGGRSSAAVSMELHMVWKLLK